MLFILFIDLYVFTFLVPCSNDIRVKTLGSVLTPMCVVGVDVYLTRMCVVGVDVYLTPMCVVGLDVICIYLRILVSNVISRWWSCLLIITRRVILVKHELLTRLEYMSCSGIRLAQSSCVIVLLSRPKL